MFILDCLRNHRDRNYTSIMPTNDDEYGTAEGPTPMSTEQKLEAILALLNEGKWRTKSISFLAILISAAATVYSFTQAGIYDTKVRHRENGCYDKYIGKYEDNGQWKQNMTKSDHDHQRDLYWDCINCPKIDHLDDKVGKWIGIGLCAFIATAIVACTASGSVGDYTTNNENKRDAINALLTEINFNELHLATGIQLNIITDNEFGDYQHMESFKENIGFALRKLRAPVENNFEGRRTEEVIGPVSVNGTTTTSDGSHVNCDPETQSRLTEGGDDEETQRLLADAQAAMNPFKFGGAS